MTPCSGIGRSPARGMGTGNRDVLHNDLQEQVTMRWRRKPMQPERWTGLFFLDRATAFAANHRP